MNPQPRDDAGVLLVDRRVRTALEVDLATGPASSLAGLRRLVAALADAGAEFGDLPHRHPAEWGRLTRPTPANALALAGLALSASERRLHRESEQTFRVLAVAAAAVCRGAESLGTTLVLRGLGRTDLPSLRGVVRAAEYAAATGAGRLTVPAADAVRVLPAPTDAADTRAERARCLRALGLPVDPADLRVTAEPPAHPDHEAADGALFRAALDGAGDPADRLGAALAYCRSSFYSANWEGMAVVAAACLPVAARLGAPDVESLLAHPDAASLDGADQALEYEPALLRHPGDLHAHLLKALGIQASFRGRHDEALAYFRAARDTGGPLSVETRAQSHLYAALTLAKRQHRLPDAVAELEAGFVAVGARAGEADPVRRERGWLHNLRGLTLFAAGDLVGALEQEKAALGCIDGLTDPSSLHLRVNLVSNVSVLQENGGRIAQAGRTWERLRREDGGATFGKHHAYRAGGLQVLGGDVDGGAERVRESLRYCAEAADDFHEFEIAAELGRLELGRDRRADAAQYFERAALAAGRLGDPYRMAVAAVGTAAVAGLGLDEHTAAAACRSITQAERAQALLAGCRAGADPASLLPGLRTKLNRPFELINI